MRLVFSASFCSSDNSRSSAASHWSSLDNVDAYILERTLPGLDTCVWFRLVFDVSLTSSKVVHHSDAYCLACTSQFPDLYVTPGQIFKAADTALERNLVARWVAARMQVDMLHAEIENLGRVANITWEPINSSSPSLCDERHFTRWGLRL